MRAFFLSAPSDIRHHGERALSSCEPSKARTRCAADCIASLAMTDAAIGRCRSSASPKAAMTATGTFSFAPGDAARAAELRRVKALATLVLAGTLALFVTAKLLLPVHPVFGFVAAFAEAATIGGLADWYAVVALFRRPLGLPIPHTAIIQSNQHRIADKLGEFIEVHFLEAAPGRCQAAPDRLRLLHRRLAARPQAQHRSRPIRPAPVARGGLGDGNFGPDELHHPPHHHPVAVGRSGAAGRRHAARLRGRGPAPGSARRYPARGASNR